MVSGPVGVGGLAGVQILPMGERALLAEVDSVAEVLALGAALATAPIAGIGDLVPAARTVLVPFDPAQIAAASVRAWIERAWSGRATDEGTNASGARSPTGAVVLDITYEGPDL
ncbi:MAG: carboxyltransferase domain-containing protein, partial [Microbacterium sp.]|uniref:carboxyltransferase domain-containing protein n=1 Tax=Microbacterium sp. TaxID=51671 RepID=UPI00271899EB